MQNKKVAKAAQIATRISGSTCAASATPGAMTMENVLPATEAFLPAADTSALKLLLSGVQRLIRGIPLILQDKKRLILVLIMASFWLLQLLQLATGVGYWGPKWLQFLTFAQGGGGGGFFNAIGGIIGKGLFAYFVTSLAMPLAGKTKPFSGVQKGVKILAVSFAVKEKQSLALLLLGGGSALISYNFITGNTSAVNSIVGIMAFIISLRALSSKYGFLRELVRVVFNKTAQNTGIMLGQQIMAGWTAGFALGVLLSLTGISNSGYIVGLILIITSLVLNFNKTTARGAFKNEA